MYQFNTSAEKKSEDALQLQLPGFVPTPLRLTTKNTDTQIIIIIIIIERQTGKQRNDVHCPFYLLNEGQRGMTASTKTPNDVFELLRCSFPPLLPVSPSALILTFLIWCTHQQNRGRLLKSIL